MQFKVCLICSGEVSKTCPISAKRGWFARPLGKDFLWRLIMCLFNLAALIFFFFLIGTLRFDNGDANGAVRLESRFFKLILGSYSKSPSYLKVRILEERWTPPSLKLLCAFSSRPNIWSFYVVVVQPGTAKKFTKIPDARAELLLCSHYNLWYRRPRCLPRHSFVRSLISH